MLSTVFVYCFWSPITFVFSLHPIHPPLYPPIYRNFKRVEFLTKLVEDLSEKKMDAWWNCRNFVLNEDLCLDYDIGGLAVSATFLITVGVFCVLASQVSSEE